MSFLHTSSNVSASYQRVARPIGYSWIIQREWYSGWYWGGRNCFLELSTLRLQLNKSLSAASETHVLWEFHIYIWILQYSSDCTDVVTWANTYIITSPNTDQFTKYWTECILLHVAPWLQSPPSPSVGVNTTLSSCHGNYHILELINENNKCTHSVTLKLCWIFPTHRRISILYIRCFGVRSSKLSKIAFLTRLRWRKMLSTFVSLITQFCLKLWYRFNIQSLLTGTQNTASNL